MLTQEYLQSILDYNKDTGIFTWKKKSSKFSKIELGTIAGSYDKYGYRRIKIDFTHYKTHRLAWLYVYGSLPKGHIDHINGVVDDNSITNLRLVSDRENQQNRKTHRAGALVGASFHKATSKWQAQIKVNKKQIYLGVYNTEQEAHEAYLREVAKYV